GAVMRDEGKFHTLGAFWPIFVPSVTAMIAFWSTLSLNMPDFTRFGRSQRQQAIGQVLGLPTTMTFFAVGRPSTWPIACWRWLRPNRVKSAPAGDRPGTRPADHDDVLRAAGGVHHRRIT